MVNRWNRKPTVVAAAVLLLALLWLATGCSNERRLPADADTPSVSAVTETDGKESAATGSPTSDPDPAPTAIPEPSTPAVASPEAAPSAPQKSTAEPEPSRSSDSAQSPSSAQPSPSAKPASPAAKPASPSVPAAVKHVTMSVVGNAEWGTIVAAEEIALKKNDSVADLLVRTLKAHKLAFDKAGSGAMFYVRGIDGLFEFDDGPTSGWKFRVNGKVPGVGAGSLEPKPSDRVEWFYTSDDADAQEDAASKGTAP